MKKALMLLLLISCVCMAAEQEFLDESVTSSPLELVQDWRILSVLALGLSIVLVAIAYMFGIGFEMPEMRAWAGTELSQIFANAIIILVLIVTMAFIDTISVAIAYDAGLDLPECTGDGTSHYDTCLQAVSNAYLSDYVDTARGSMRHILVENIKAINTMSQRAGIYCISIYCAQVGLTTTFAAHYLLDSDMYTVLFEYYTNLIGFMEAQLFFVNNISFRVGPVLLATGIVARAFYFTRKIGGLLIAVALGITFFFPGMYIFDWVTLDMAVMGDKGLDSQEMDCPPECSKQTPIAYYYNDSGLQLIFNPSQLRPLFDSDIIPVQMYAGTLDKATGQNGSADGKLVTSCTYNDTSAEPYNMVDCPMICRTLPYPITPQCTNLTEQMACHGVPEECKVIRKVEGVESDPDYLACPLSCKVVPPLRSDCAWKVTGCSATDCDNIEQDGGSNKVGKCLESSMDCRVAMRSDLSWRPDVPGDNQAKEKECKKAKECIASLDAYESCTYVFPDTGKCDDLCGGCPSYCRLTGADWNELPSNLKTECQDSASLCNSCHETCKVKISDIEAMNPPSGKCTDCPAEMRLLGAGLDEAYSTGGCSMSACPPEYRTFMPRSACEMCLFTQEAYAWAPPINNQCDDLCRPSTDIPTKDASEYTKVGEDGLVGKADIQSLSKLMLPAYVLPLFNIVATLVFIRGLSRILGGDIEIPGISKVF